MKKENILEGTIHSIPDDMMSALLLKKDILEKRNNLTPLARNEWICRVTIVKKDVTREKHLIRLIEDLADGKKRPCCRP
jgi:uncharacterized protein YdeI (YjbR/CyaY-like superfamily)